MRPSKKDHLHLIILLTILDITTFYLIYIHTPECICVGFCFCFLIYTYLGKSCLVSDIDLLLPGH